MGIEFRCENCGKLLNVDAGPGESVKCAHCHKKVAVPEGLASLPQPRAPGSAPPPPGEPEAQAEAAPSQGDPVMAVMAHVMPWVISLFFHLGVGLVMMFVVLIVQDTESSKLKEQEGQEVTKVQKTRKKVEDDQQRSKIKREARQSQKVIRRSRDINQVDMEDAGTGRRAEPSGVIGTGGGGTPGGGLAAYGRAQIGGGDGLGVTFLDNPVRGDYIVYVIDRSGSMAGGGAFDILRMRLGESIAELSENQYFHLIFFGPDKPVEKTPRRLVPADDASKANAAEFLFEVTPKGQTQVLPALKRAFEVFGGVRGEGKKLLFLLSDGDFQGLGGASNRYGGKSGNEAVIEWLKDHNDQDGDGRPDVAIHTFLYRGDEPDAKKVMEKIAARHGGEFTHVRQ
ncbi:MAG: vWA domain-containing protein [Planctomycetota bacterium]